MHIVKGQCEHCKRDTTVVDNTEETLGAPVFCRRCALKLSQQVDELFRSMQAAVTERNRIGAELFELRKKLN